MRKFIIFLALFQSSFVLFSQTAFKNEVLLFPKNKPVVLEVNGKKQTLNSSVLFNRNTSVKIISGEVNLLASNGKETNFSLGQSFKIVKAKNKPSELKKVSSFLNKPTTFLPNLYNNERSGAQLFPMWSKVASIENVMFLCGDNIDEKASFRLFTKSADSLIWQSNNIGKKIKPPSTVLKNGASYYWKLYNGSNSQKGKFQILSKLQQKQLKTKEPKKVQAFITVVFMYLEHGYYFDAIATLTVAKKKFPKSEIFPAMLSKLLVN